MSLFNLKQEHRLAGADRSSIFFLKVKGLSFSITKEGGCGGVGVGTGDGLVVSSKKNAPTTGGHVFQATGTTFKFVQNIIWTNLLTKFHDDRTINMASRVLTRKNATPPWWPYIIGTNHLTKFHDDRTINVIYGHIKKNAPPPDRKINVASRVLTRKNAPPPGSHVFKPSSIIFELVQDIIGVKILTKFHKDRTINPRKNAPPLGSHVFQANVTIFELIHDIIETNLLNKFHEDWTINVASRVFTRKNAPTLGSHVFQANVTIFELIQDIIETNLPTKFHEDWTINVASRVKTAPPPWRPYINETNVLTKFHDDWAKIVTSRVFTRNTAPPPIYIMAMFFERTRTIFELNQHII
ncbi:hypothetical protein DPMN_112866 [Dreissena polymorpha]|uniref:PRELI/MSF1 domain-containing protein n=1 Tax=Dreissena polymorpha TaxID=45954 RepID=A0A9D4KGG3_DREPO|nr:hypothetical protein DPMN_112866 [Dreissena polymorpha]